MNTNPKAKRVLVYGDSLPWGLIPGSTTFERFPSDIRWPGVLQNILGNDFDVLEECLCARTLDSDDPRPGFEGRNGSSHIAAVLDSHDPIDIIILSLGLNEIKSIYNWSSVEVAEKTKGLIQLIKNRKPNLHETNPRIILCTQPEINEETEYWGDLWIGSNKKSIALAEEFRKLAEELNVEVLDVNKLVKTGKDGVHLDEHAHKVIAEGLVGLLKK